MRVLIKNMKPFLPSNSSEKWGRLSLKIILVRHGKPCASHNSMVSCVEFAKWVRAYHHSKVHVDSLPSETLRARIVGTFIVSSNLNRAVCSAILCTDAPPNIVLNDLREADIPRFKWPIRMSVNLWLLASRLMWFMGVSGRSESLKAMQQRMMKATDSLIGLAQQKKSVSVFSHGFTNRFITRELMRRGWIVTYKSKGFWGVTELHYRSQRSSD